MLYTTRTLTLSGAWQALEGDPEAAAAGLPCRSAPSDHLPIAACFSIGGTDVLPPNVAATLEAELVELEAKHASAFNAMKGEQLVAMNALQTKEANAAAVAAAMADTAQVAEAAGAVATDGDDSAAAERPKKKQKKKKQRKEVSEEFKGMKRTHREAEKQVKVTHLAERTAWIESKVGLEREHVAWVLLSDPNGWVESGKR